MGRPPHALLTRDEIARTALELLDHEGPEGLGMRRLARKLEVKAPSLYHHVSGQDEIIDLIHALIDTEIDTTTLDDSNWRRGLDRFVRSYRQAYLHHPHAIGLVTRRTLLVSSVLKVYDSVAAALVRAGLPLADAMRVIAVIDCIVLGSAVDNFSAGFASQTSDYRPYYPSLADIIDASNRSTVNDEAFDAALQLLLDDLDRRLTADFDRVTSAAGPYLT